MENEKLLEKNQNRKGESKMKKVLGILLTIVLVIGLGFLVYYDFTSHEDHDDCTDHSHNHEIEHDTRILDQIVHYSIHILVCVVFCTIFHNPTHKFFNFIKECFGIKVKEEGCKSCHHSHSEDCHEK